MKEVEKEIQKPKKKELPEKHYLKLATTIFLTVAACITFFFILYRIDEVIAIWDSLIKSAEPIIIGLVLAYLLMPVKEFIEKRVYKLLQKAKLKESTAQALARAVGIASAIFFLFAILASLIAMLVPALGTSVIGLVTAMPVYVETFVAWMQEIGIADSAVADWIGDSINSITAMFIEWAKNELLPLAQQYIAQITSGFFAVVSAILNFIIGIIVMVYVMAIRDDLVGQGKKIIYAVFPAKKGNAIVETIRKSNQIFGGFIVGKIIDSAIIGVICYIGCLILNIPSPILIAFIVGVTNVIPFFGPFIGAIPSILLVLIQSPIHALYLAIFILVLQQVDGNIIGPKILGDNTGLASFWVLFSILIAGGLFGFFGMLLGVPTFAVIYYITQRVLKHRMEKKNLPTETEDYVRLVYIDEKTNEIKYPNEVDEIEEK